MYVPLTMEGNLVVDGILASCYPSSYHDMAHLAMTPIRWFPRMIEMIFGDDNGFQALVNILEHVGRSVLPNEFA